MTESSPTARALLALELLQSRPGITAEQLATRLGVSGRAARRYVAILREAGIPIDSVRGPYGGYRVGRGLRLPPLMFDATEALGLVMAVLDGHHAAADPADPVGRALGKLVRALPASVAAQAEAVRRTTAAVPDRSAARPDPGITHTLVQACGERRLVLLGYRTESGREWSAEVEPWAVLVRHGRWYVLCWSHGARARRAYRIDRATSAEVLPHRFTPPDDLDPVRDLEEHLAAGWDHATDVVVDAPVDAVSRVLPRTLGRLEALPDGRTRLTGSTSNPAWYAEELARLSAPFRITGGPELRARSRELALRMLAATD